MPPILHLVRHAQGEHSVAPEGHSIRDPRLTEEGVKQCHALRDSFQHHGSIRLLVASPMTRTLQTALQAFSPCLPTCPPIVALPMAQEASAATSDTGRSAAELRKEFCESQVDLSWVEEDWFEHGGRYAIDVESLNRRAKELRVWLREREEGHVVLVCHGIFCHYLTGSVDAEGNQTEGCWKDAECRTYEFGEGEGAEILETMESLQERKERDLAIDGETDVELPN